jgi:hypothetical protein
VSAAGRRSIPIVMARVDPDVLDDRECSLIFIARNTREARQAEAVLTERAVDYTLAFEPFLHAGLFGVSSLNGVGFYVASEHAAASRTILSENGLGVGIVEEEP